MKKGYSHVFPLALMLSASTANAEFDWSVETGVDVRHTNNAARDNAKESMTQKSLNISPQMSLSTTDTELDVNYDLSWIEYSDIFNNRRTIQGFASLRQQLVDQKFYWVATQSSEDLVVDSASRDIPTNRDQRSTFITGPDFMFRLSNVDSVTLSARFEDVRFDEVENNSETSSGSIDYSRSISPVTSANLRVGYEETKFTEENNQDVDNEAYTVSIGVDSRRRWGNFALAAGGNRYKNTDEGGASSSETEVDGLFLDFSVSNNEGIHNWNVNVNHQLTNSTVGLGLSIEEEGFESVDYNINIIDIVERTRVSGTYARNMMRERLVLSIDTSYDEMAYENNASQDEKSQSVRLGANYSVSEAMDLVAGWAVVHTEFVGDPNFDSQDEKRLSVDANWRVRRTLALRFGVEYSTREVDALLPSGEYNAFDITASANYTFD